VNKQVNYIVQGFLLALFIPISGFIINKISLIESIKKDRSIIIDNDVTPKLSVLTEAAAKGKLLFMQKCGACHSLSKDQTGPSLIGIDERGPWNERQNLYDWIRNPSEFMRRNTYAIQLKEKYGTMMTAFADITNGEIDNIVAYINHAGKQRVY
jgi:cytochrome c2